MVFSAAPTWYVLVSEQVYGPYSAEQMRQFTQEGRIVTTSHISSDPAKGFFLAETFPDFARWSGPDTPPVLELTHPTREQSFAARARRQTKSQIPNQIHQPIAHQPNAHQNEGASQASKPSVFIVMAEINSRQAMKFLHALQKLGHAQRIGDSLWLVKTDKPLEHTKDYLASTLSKSDRLFILDTLNNRPAWHNIGADMDARIREFWQDAL